MYMKLESFEIIIQVENSRFAKFLQDWKLKRRIRMEGDSKCIENATIQGVNVLNNLWSFVCSISTRWMGINSSFEESLLRASDQNS